jgi:Ca2+-binding RTX toxin-like protein
MFSLLSKLVGPRTTAATKTATCLQARPQLEGLEDRMVMSTTVVNGDLYIRATNANDTVTVRQETHSGITYYKVTENGVNTFVTASRVTGGDVAFYGYNGNDYFNNYTGLKTYAWGHAGNDTLIGSWNDDMLDGGTGSDRLYGYQGIDKLHAGADYSYNYLDGGTGDDHLYGGYGIDHLYGQSGNDVLYGNLGNDYLSGGTGYDRLFGQDGSDTLNGGDDSVRDYLYGGAGADWFQQDLVWYGYNMDLAPDFYAAGGDRYYN